MCFQWNSLFRNCKTFQLVPQIPPIDLNMDICIFVLCRLIRQTGAKPSALMMKNDACCMKDTLFRITLETKNLLLRFDFKFVVILFKVIIR